MVVLGGEWSGVEWSGVEGRVLEVSWRLEDGMVGIYNKGRMPGICGGVVIYRISF